MLVVVDKNLDEIIPSKYRKLRRVLKDLRMYDPDVCRCIEDDIWNEYDGTPDEDEASEFFIENYPKIFAQYGSKYIPADMCECEDED